MKIGIISQARMTSSRMPGKVLAKIKESPVLDYHIKRLRTSGIPIIIATTINDTDQEICDHLNSLGIPYFRGDENNVLERFYLAAKNFNLDVIVRVTSDCPLIDGELIGKSCDIYKRMYNENLYLSNCIKRTFPRGFDFEILSFHLLEEAYNSAVLPSDKEHVTPFIHQNRNQKVILHNIEYSNEDKSNYRITLDTPIDFKLIETLIENYNADALGYKEIIKILDENPEVARINAQVEQKKWL